MDIVSIGPNTVSDQDWLTILVWSWLLVFKKVFTTFTFFKDAIGLEDDPYQVGHKIQNHTEVNFPGSGGDPQLPPWSARFPQDRPPGDKSLDNW